MVLYPLRKQYSRLDGMKIPVNSLVGKLQHSQALLSEDFRDSLQKAARQQLHEIIANVDTYVDHVKHEVVMGQQTILFET